MEKNLNKSSRKDFLKKVLGLSFLTFTFSNVLLKNIFKFSKTSKIYFRENAESVKRVIGK